LITNHRDGYWLKLYVVSDSGHTANMGFSDFFTIKNSTALLATSLSSSLSPGAKAGIAVGATVGAGLILGICIFLYWRSRWARMRTSKDYELSKRNCWTRLGG